MQEGGCFRKLEVKTKCPGSSSLIYLCNRGQVTCTRMKGEEAAPTKIRLAREEETNASDNRRYET